MNLFSLVPCEYAVVCSTIREVAESIQNVIVETADGIVVLDEYFIIAWKISALKTEYKQIKLPILLL